MAFLFNVSLNSYSMLMIAIIYIQIIKKSEKEEMFSFF